MSQQIADLVDLAVLRCGNISRLARALGVQRATIYYWINGHSTPRGVTLLKLQAIALLPEGTKPGERQGK